MTGKKQRGVFMLMLVIALVLTITSYYFSSISVIGMEVDRSLKTQTELKRAKQALLNYAVTKWREPLEGGKIGKLPCPDIDNTTFEGVQNSTCDTAYANSAGNFPWFTLGVEAPRDGSGNCFIYVVSPAYRPAPVAALNPDSFGQIRIVDSTGAIVLGLTPEERPVVVIIAPGRTLADQARVFDINSTCGKDYSNIAAYLDFDGTTNNADIKDSANDTIDVFVNRYPDSDREDSFNPLNDSLITITHKEFWQVLDSSINEDSAFDDQMKNLTEALALCFAAYGNASTNHLPMPADIALSEYRQTSVYDDGSSFTSSFSGRLPLKFTNANTEIPSSAENSLFNNTFCDNLVTSVPVTVNFTNDTGADSGTYKRLLENWKDHFFYAVSKAYSPAEAATGCSSDCIDVAGTEYAGIVFYSGHIRTGQQRYAPPFDADDKADVSNYLENGNWVLFPDNVGNQTYATVNTTNSNDVMFCINTDMTVTSC